MLTGRSIDRVLASVLVCAVAPGVVRGTRAARKEYLAIAASDSASPNDLYVYTYAVIAVWLILAITSGLVMVLLALIGDHSAGNTGRSLGLIVGVCLTFFCIAGAADATWRSLIIYAVRRRFRRSGQLSDRDAARLRIARGEYPRLAMQMVVGLSAVAFAASYLF